MNFFKNYLVFWVNWGYWVYPKMVEKVAVAYKNNPATRTFINNLLQNTHPNVRYRLGYNWFIRAMLLGIPQQRSMTEKLGVCNSMDTSTLPRALIVS